MKKIISIICLAMLPFFCIAQESTTTETPATQSEVANSKEVQVESLATPSSSTSADDSKSSKGLFVENETQDMIIWILSAVFFVILWIILPKGLIRFFACIPSIAAGQGMAPKTGCGFLTVVGIAIFAAAMLTTYLAKWFS